MRLLERPYEQSTHHLGDIFLDLLTRCLAHGFLSLFLDLPFDVFLLVSLLDDDVLEHVFLS